MGKLEGLAFVETVLGDQRGEEAAVHAARNVMPRGDGEEGARVVVEADGIVKARGFCGGAAEAQHAFRAVMEPPRRAQAQAGIVAGERREFAAVG